MREILANQQGLEDVLDEVFLGVKDELRFIMVDSHEAVRIGDLEKNSMAIKVVSPDPTERCSQTRRLREGVDDGTLRRGEDGMLRICIDTTDRG